MKNRFRPDICVLIIAALLMQPVWAHLTCAGELSCPEEEVEDKSGSGTVVVISEEELEFYLRGFTVSVCDAVYDGREHPAKVTCSINEIAEAGYRVYYYNQVGSREAYYSEEPPVKAGTYYIKIETNASHNYDAVEITYVRWRFTIDKREITVSGLSAADKDYDGSADAEIIGIPSMSGKVEGDDLELVIGKASFDRADACEDAEIMFSRFALKGEDKDNYVLKQPVSTKASIRPLSMIGCRVILTDTAFEYDGTEKYVRVDKVVNSEGVVLDPDEDYYVSGSDFGREKGIYTVLVSGRGNCTGTVYANWSITAPSVKVRAANVNAVYDGTPYGVSINCIEPASGCVIRYGTKEGIYDLTQSPSITDAGELTVYYWAGAPGYTGRTGSARIVVKPKPVTVRADDKAKFLKHADPPFTATVTGLLDTASQDCIDYYLSRAAGEEAGTYSIIPAGKRLQGNYSVNYENGILTISERKTSGITVREPVSVSTKTVDGREIRTVTFNRKVAVKQKLDASEYLGSCRKYEVSPKGAAVINKRKKMITARKTGDITITAYDKEGKNWTKKEEIKLNAEAVKVKQKVLRLTAGGDAFPGDSNLSDGALTPDLWESLDPSVASVDGRTGSITPLAKGKTRITACYGSGAGAIKVVFRVLVNK